MALLFYLRSGISAVLKTSFLRDLLEATCSIKNPCREMSSIHSGNIKEVYDVPMRVIIRPLVPTLDENKVLSLMDTLEDPTQKGNVPPIDILWVKGREGGDYYFSFGGCHRFEAHKRLQRETIPCKIVKSTVEDMKVYLGSSMPDLK